jgi:choline dehydrogenase-like flavoprotein
MMMAGNAIPRGTELAVDVCVVGAGAAGISIALELMDRGLSVLVLESGTLEHEPRLQALYAGEVADRALHSPPDRYRDRRFGGTTATWGGRCTPYDPIDFESRAAVPLSGWPIGYQDVLPYYARANALLEAGRFEYDADKAFDPPAPPLIDGFVSDRVRTNGLERFSCPTNFALRYGKRLRQARDVRVILGASCTRIQLRADGASVRALAVATLEGNRFSVAARSVLLAVGGLETARLLLASRDLVPAGIGNRHDVVGRYYMCHLAAAVGTLAVSGPPSRVRHGYEVAPEGVYCRRRLSLSADEQRRLGVANLVARLHFSRITDPSHGNGVLSGICLARPLIPYEYGKRLEDGTPTTVGTSLRHLGNVLAHPWDCTSFLGHWIAKRTLAERRFPSVILRNRTNRFSLEVHAEQQPLSASRVSLSDRVDALGVPEVRVEWRYCAADIDSIRRTLDVFSEEFARSGVARFEYDAVTLEEDLLRFGAYGGHHTGTARMGTDVRTSVVDADCKVHGIDNLFIAGSAVFPTTSQANPTLTVVAMALRLARHVASRSAVSRTPRSVESASPVPAGGCR